METKKQYNYCLDFFKGLACMFVVFMHCEFPGIMGIAVQAISRFCVPFFFMVSGYFCFRPIVQTTVYKADDSFSGEGKPIYNKLKHIGKITFYTVLFYLVFVLLQQPFLHNINLTLSYRRIIGWIVFNQPFIISGHCWFLFALIYAYALYGIMESFHFRKIAYYLAAAMFFIYIILAQGMHLSGIHIPNMYYRNWLVEAFPYFMLGHWLHENQDSINISNKTLIVIIAITTLLCLLERYLMGRDFGVNIVTIPQVFAMFVFAIKNPKKYEGAIQRLGRDYSMLVYIIHPAIWLLLNVVYALLGMKEITVMLYLKPILVFIFSVIFAWLFNWIEENLQKK